MQQAILSGEMLSCFMFVFSFYLNHEEFHLDSEIPYYCVRTSAAQSAKGVNMLLPRDDLFHLNAGSCSGGSK